MNASNRVNIAIAVVDMSWIYSLGDAHATPKHAANSSGVSCVSTGGLVLAL